ncbi:MAG: hypothetical protein OHK0011_15910 [Turneriella sp.]
MDRCSLRAGFPGQLLGAGVALRSDFLLLRLPLYAMVSFSKSQLLSQRIDGKNNACAVSNGSASVELL